MNAAAEAEKPTEMLLSTQSTALQRQESDDRKYNLARRLTSRDTIAILAPLLPIAVLAGLLAGVTRGAYSKGRSCGVDCDPNGNIRVRSCVIVGRTGKGHPFDVDYSLAIGLGWGELSFAAAKAIVVLWDALVGRGWQALTAWIIYVVFRRCWAVQYERAKTGVPVQAVMSLQYQTVSMGALRSSASLLSSRVLRSWRAAASTLVLLLSTLHVFLAPNWLSAMTGYMALSDPMVRLNGTTFIAASGPGGLQTCNLIVVDGERIGLPHNACMQQPQDLAFSNMRLGQGCEALPKAGCEYYSAAAYLVTYSPLSSNGSLAGNVNSTFHAIDQVYHLSPPLLTIRSPAQYTMGYDFHVYNTDYLRDNGVCQPRNKYKWGFSFNLTFAWLLTSNVLALSLYAVWLSTFRGGELADTVFGSEKTVMVVAEAYQDVLGREAPRMSNEELASARKNCHIGVDVSKCSGVDVSLPRAEKTWPADAAVG